MGSSFEFIIAALMQKDYGLVAEMVLHLPDPITQRLPSASDLQRRKEAMILACDELAAEKGWQL
jgi:hypothetical protein